MKTTLCFTLILFAITNAEICRNVVKATDTNFKISINAERNNCGKWQKSITVHNSHQDEAKHNIDVEQKVSGNTTTFIITVVENGQCDYKPPKSPMFREDYIYYPGKGFYKYHQPAIWANAKNICETEGSHLAVVNSHAEAELLVKIFNSHPKASVPHPDYILLGFNDLEVEGQYVSILGGPLKNTGFYKWGQGQPDDAGGNEDCGSLHRSGVLNDFPCSIAANFICEKEIH